MNNEKVLHQVKSSKLNLVGAKTGNAFGRNIFIYLNNQ